MTDPQHAKRMHDQALHFADAGMIAERNGNESVARMCWTYGSTLESEAAAFADENWKQIFAESAETLKRWGERGRRSKPTESEGE